ncbi:MAG: sugar phosphate isomerase/epimerase [Verrucomicrobia bacterium]|nr:sugar phosphate isomerase/epimerase [Verrucomicrobiota bacterium]
MQTHPPSLDRRQFVQSVALAGAASALGLGSDSGVEPSASARKIKLGLDNFAVRDMKWKAPQLIDYAASLKTDSLFITDFGPFESREDKYLKEIRVQAEDKGLQIQLGSWSICPTSKAFRKDWGTAEEHLALGLRMAKALGSPVFRVVLGNGDDRRSEGGIEARIEDTVQVCKACRNRALDAGVKIAVENHAGDMQAWELVTLIEAAGKDYVGANMDSGNATWTMEDPLASLEILAPYVVTTSLRDSAVWESENGATVQWTAMGEGTVDLKAYFAKFAALCPGVPVHIETISGFNREIPYLREDFWKAWPKARAKDFARFVALAKKGKPREPRRGGNAQEFQKSEIEKSIQYCKEALGLGLKA